ncbi:MAG: phosphoribosyl-AMP cyclohydrolase [Deferribacteraceae bacterium]|jgi:phosphoribosyl-AMP cyclohydrolase|nr:phosphoribosyl-AMP cyclohydrolase [Deferribacteraceae bacterium]
MSLEEPKFNPVRTEDARCIDWSKTPLVPAVVQEQSGAVLMLAYVSEEAFNLTISKGYAHYFSRSRNKLWLKGETSGNLQRVIEVRVDCDNDALLYIVSQEGSGACHTGEYTCFYRKVWEA